MTRKMSLNSENDEEPGRLGLVADLTGALKSAPTTGCRWEHLFVPRARHNLLCEPEAGSARRPLHRRRHRRLSRSTAATPATCARAPATL